LSKTIKAILTVLIISGIYLTSVVEASAATQRTEYIKRRICEVFGPNCKEALIIAKYESGYREKVISRTGDYGVFQLNCRWQKRRVGGNCKKFLDLETNLRIAKQIYSEQNWRPWYTRKYLK